MKTMMSRSRFFLFCSIHLGLLLILSNADGIPVADIKSMEDSESDGMMMGKVCNGSVSECWTEMNRRVLLGLPQKRYISYDTLDRDMVPCQRPGASYYNCNGGQANPYRRGCSVITWCARDSDINN